MLVSLDGQLRLAVLKRDHPIMLPPMVLYLLNSIQTIGFIIYVET